MGLMDKVRAQSTQLAQMAQETAREGKVKLDQAQAKRRADAMFRDLGATVYAERTGRGTPDSKDKIDRLVDALSRQEASQGLGDPDGSAARGPAPRRRAWRTPHPAARGPRSAAPGRARPGRQRARDSAAPGSGAPGQSTWLDQGRLAQWQASWAAVADGTPVEDGGRVRRGRPRRHRVAVRAQHDPHPGQPLHLLQ